MQPDQIEKAMLDPASVFDTPEKIVSDADLTKTQKIEILRRWENQVADEAVALEEDMPGEESDLPRRILVALGEADRSRTNLADEAAWPAPRCAWEGQAGRLETMRSYAIGKPHPP